MDNINLFKQHIVKIFRWLYEQSPKPQCNQLYDRMRAHFLEITDDEWKQIGIFLSGFSNGYRVCNSKKNNICIKDVESLFFLQPNINILCIYIKNICSDLINIHAEEQKSEILETIESNKQKELIGCNMSEITDKSVEKIDVVDTCRQSDSQKQEENDRQCLDVYILTKEEETMINPPPEITDKSEAIDTNRQNSSQNYEEDEPVQIESIWKYISVQEEPDRHEEYSCYGEDPMEGLKIIGARVRGKKHKHEGTNCDDWFEVTTSGEWNIIALSDGAGSKKFSRVGARISCQTAVKYLAEHLKSYKIKENEEWSSIIKKEEDTEAFVKEKLKFVRETLYEAINKAYEAIEEVARDRNHHVNDFSATLLIVVHTLVKDNDYECSLGLTCQIGDGIISIIDINGNLRLLGIPDTGEFSGETEFLTSQKKLLPENLESKTFIFHYICPIKVLMVMSDGVADDYFPNDPELLKLYGDLVLNGIIDIKGYSTEEIQQSLSHTKLQILEEVKITDFSIDGEQITKNGAFRLPIQSVKTYADKLGLSIQEVVKSQPLLLVGRKNLAGIKEKDTAEDKLKYWLDSYYVRGSFDDRTLVILYREELN